MVERTSEAEVGPTVSVITVVRNDVAHIEETIQSVLGQSYPCVEHHVVDGGSTDGTVEIIRQHASRLASWSTEPDRDIYDAMNKGMLRASEGSYLSFLNSGDAFMNEDVLLSVFSHPDVPGADVVYGDVVNVYPEGRERYAKAGEFSLSALLESGTAVVCHQAMFVRREIAPFYDPSLFLKGELNWYFDLVDNNPSLKAVHVGLPIIRYRIGGLGYQRFITNRLEWLKVAYHRYGCEPFQRYGYAAQFIRAIEWRYPWVRLLTRSYSRLRFRKSA